MDEEIKVSYLVPEAELFPVVDKSNLDKAIKLFIQEEDKLPLELRKVFAEKYKEKAKELGVDEDLPHIVKQYLGLLGTDFKLAKGLLDKKIARAETCAARGDTQCDEKSLEELKKSAHLCELVHGMHKSAEDISQFTDREFLLKFADHLWELDKRLGFDRDDMKALGNSYNIIFNKTAASDEDYLEPKDSPIDKNSTFSKVSPLEEITKSQIISLFGEDVLEGLEDETGEIDQEKARQLVEFARRQV